MFAVDKLVNQSKGDCSVSMGSSFDTLTDTETQSSMPNHCHPNDLEILSRQCYGFPLLYVIITK